MLKGKISPKSVAGEVTAGVGKCSLLGMRQEPVMAVQWHCWA